MIMKSKVQLKKAYSFLLRSYIIMMITSLGISLFGYTYSYWTIRQDLNMNYSALLNEEKLTYDKEWKRIESSISAAASNRIVRQLAQLEEWQAIHLFDVVDLISELKASLGNNDVMESIGVYFYQNQSFVTNYGRYAAQINYICLMSYHRSVEDFISSMKGVSGYFVLKEGIESNLVIYHNIFDNRYKEVIATAYAIIPWSNLREAGRSMIISKHSGSYLINSEGIVIGNTTPQIEIPEQDASCLQKDQVLFQRKMEGKDYILSSITSDIFDIKYVIYAPKSVFFRNIQIYRYIIASEIIVFILLGGYLAIYFSKKNTLPVERLLTMLKVKRSEAEDSSFEQIYQNLENSLQSLISGHENLYQRMNNIDLVVEKYVFTNLMRNWKPDDGWMEEYLSRIRQKYSLSDYRIVLFSFDQVNQSLFRKEEQDESNQSVDYPLMIFSIENVIKEIIFKYDYHNPSIDASNKGIIIEMGDMTACIVNSTAGAALYSLQEAVLQCIDFFRTVFKIESYASISGMHKEYEELELAYEEALMTITHKSFWGNKIEDVILFDKEKAGYHDSHRDNKLFVQAKKMSSSLMRKDYQKASDLLDETIELCFSKDLHKLSFNQYQAATLIFVILSNLSDIGIFDEAIISNNDWTSSDRILSMSSLEKIRVSLHTILDEIAQHYEEKSSIMEEPAWLSGIECYVLEQYANPEINISAISNQFNISINHIGRTFKKYRGINLLDYIHQLRINKCKELLDQGMSVTDCAKEVGYIDAKSFIRAFKRYEGITPGQYKLSK